MLGVGMSLVAKGKEAFLRYLRVAKPEIFLPPPSDLNFAFRLERHGLQLSHALC